MASILLSNAPYPEPAVPGRPGPAARASGAAWARPLSGRRSAAPYFSNIAAGRPFGPGALGYELALQAADRQLAKGEES